jgi:hypothetical protein
MGFLSIGPSGLVFTLILLYFVGIGLSYLAYAGRNEAATKKSITEEGST